MQIKRKELVSIVKQLKQQGRKIGFTSGVFDLLHGGHISYLKEAQKNCDILIVGVNSDASVKCYKSSKRPIISEKDRLNLIDTLEMVNYSFIFTEKNNHKNIEILKPDIYLKAGDYSHNTLSSAPLVKQYGGEVKLISFQSGYSTSKIIQKIINLYQSSPPTQTIASSIEIKKDPQPTVFLDRDGTINEEVEYLHRKSKFKLLPGALEGMKTIQTLGYRIAIVTTQAGIGLGYFTEEDFYQVNKIFLKVCQQKGIVIDKIYYCPHSKAENCLCRKPGIGLFERAREDIPSDMSKSVMIGDKTSDIQAGRNAKLYTILVKTGHGGRDLEYSAHPNYIAQDLVDAANHLRSQVGRIKQG